MRLVARASAYQDIGVDQLVLLPGKPPTKIRQYKRKKPSDLLALDPSFVPFGMSEGDHTVTPPPNSPLQEFPPNTVESPKVEPRANEIS